MCIPVENRKLSCVECCSHTNTRWHIVLSNSNIQGHQLEHTNNIRHQFECVTTSRAPLLCQIAEHFLSIDRSFIQDTNVDYWKSILLSHFLWKGWFIFDKNDLILHKSFYFQTDPTYLVFIAEVYTVHLHHTNICIK